MLRIHKRNVVVPHILTGASVFLIGMIGSIGVLHALNVPKDAANKTTDSSKSRPAKETAVSQDMPVITKGQQSEPTEPTFTAQPAASEVQPTQRQQSAASSPSSTPAQSQPVPIQPSTPTPPVANPVAPEPATPSPVIPPTEEETSPVDSTTEPQ